jgi:hypothetical protein
MDHQRAEVIKAAISKGILAEISAVERGVYPKKDVELIRQILERYGF